MADAIGKLFKAYKAGNVSEYLVQPEEHKPENVEPEPAEDTGSSSPEPEVSVGAYRYALQMRPAALAQYLKVTKQFCRALMKVTRIMNMHATALLLTIPRFLISK